MRHTMPKRQWEKASEAVRRRRNMPTRKWEKEREVAQVDRTQIRKTLKTGNSREKAREAA